MGNYSLSLMTKIDLLFGTALYSNILSVCYVSIPLGY